MRYEAVIRSLQIELQSAVPFTSTLLNLATGLDRANPIGLSASELVTL